MGEPLSLKECIKRLDTSKAYLAKEIMSGRLKVRYMIGRYYIIDSDDFDEYLEKYTSDGWMNEQEIARYLGLVPLSVINAFHDYESAGQYVGVNSNFPNIVYNIDSQIIKHIFKIKGWDKYAKPDGHKQGKTFASESERRAYARGPRIRRTEEMRKRSYDRN